MTAGGERVDGGRPRRAPVASGPRAHVAALTRALAGPGLVRRPLPAVPGPGRRAAVLVLFGERDGGPGDGGGPREDGGFPRAGALPDVLLLRRADALRSHPGQIAFPGGTAEDTDRGPAATALREAVEETGLDAAGVDVLGALPAVGPLPTGFTVVPVLAWWRAPSVVGVVDPHESAEVWRVGVDSLVDPARRGTVIGPRGHRGPAFVLPVPGPRRVLWGFTAFVLAELLGRTGWSRPWDPERRIVLE